MEYFKPHISSMQGRDQKWKGDRCLPCFFHELVTIVWELSCKKYNFRDGQAVGSEYHHNSKDSICSYFKHEIGKRFTIKIH